MIVDRLGAVPLVLQLPIGVESEFAGVVDLVRMKAIMWQDETLGAKFDVIDIPADMAKQAAEYRHKLLEMAVEQDDAALEAYLAGKEPDEVTLIKCIRKGTVAFAFVPVICGSAFKNKGVQPLLDAVVDYLAGADRHRRHQRHRRWTPTNRSMRHASDDEPFAGSRLQDHDRSRLSVR